MSQPYSMFLAREIKQKLRRIFVRFFLGHPLLETVHDDHDSTSVPIVIKYYVDYKWIERHFYYEHWNQ